MIIIAKFAGTCPCCSVRIDVGNKVEWSKGEKAKHVACGGSSTVSKSVARPAARTSSRRSGTWTGCSCGSVTEYSKSSDCWTCRHDAE
jgi:hypothetical protein